MKVTQIAASLLLAAALCPSPARAQTLHLVTATNTNDLQIGNGVQSNRTAMLSTMSAIANILHLRFDEHASLSAAGAQFNCKTIRHAIGSVAPGPNDVLVFYYSGHGERRLEDPTPLPAMACDDPDNPRPEPRLTLQEAIHTLMGKHARLTIVLADLCNFALPPRQQMTVAAIETPEAQAYRRLLLETAGVIVLDSSSPGEFSWYTSGGGYFTDQFIATLKHPPGGAQATWDGFIAKVTEPIPVKVGAPVLDPQTSRPLVQAGQDVLESPQALIRLTAAPQ